MKIIKLILVLAVILCVSLLSYSQKLITLEQAMDIALDNSPEIRKSRLNMEKNKEYLNAQLASLKSRFLFDVTPFIFSREERYDEFFSEWYTTENKGANASLIISQPIKFSDGSLSLRNDFGYQDNFSEGNNYVNYGNINAGQTINPDDDFGFRITSPSYTNTPFNLYLQYEDTSGNNYQQNLPFFYTFPVQGSQSPVLSAGTL